MLQVRRDEPPQPPRVGRQPNPNDFVIGGAGGVTARFRPREDQRALTDALNASLDTAVSESVMRESAAAAQQPHQQVQASRTLTTPVQAACKKARSTLLL